MLVSSIGYLHKSPNMTKVNPEYSKVQAKPVTNRGLSENTHSSSFALWNKLLKLFGFSEKVSEKSLNISV